jgi:hypothetical protein
MLTSTKVIALPFEAILDRIPTVDDNQHFAEEVELHDRSMFLGPLADRDPWLELVDLVCVTDDRETLGTRDVPVLLAKFPFLNSKMDDQ